MPLKFGNQDIRLLEKIGDCLPDHSFNGISSYLRAGTRVALAIAIDEVSLAVAVITSIVCDAANGVSAQSSATEAAMKYTSQEVFPFGIPFSQL